MTASRILRSRLDSSCEGISANLGTTSNDCQVSREAIEPEPAERRELESVITLYRGPSGVNPRLSTNKFRTGETQPIRSAQPEIHSFRRTAVVVQKFMPTDWIELPGKAGLLFLNDIEGPSDLGHSRFDAGEVELLLNLGK